MKTPEGKYRVTRLMKQTMTELVGIGDTVQEARAKLKDNVRAYREGMFAGTSLVKTKDTIRSPGIEFFRTQAGSITSRQTDREIHVMARPDLAEWIAKGRPVKG